ncbi:MAG: secondary thiamine-phosphate synthase enzyme YjbQ [Phycisphaerales bacterium JB058]
MIRELTIQTPGRGLHEITREIAKVVREAGVDAGLCTVFIRHTSASLIIQENADPSARRDLERWLDAHVPDGTAYEHTDEGPDDMPSHIRSVLTATSLGIPVMDGRLALGTWQGMYLWEHRLAAHTRRIVVHVSS